MSEEGAGWEQQMDNERRRYEEEHGWLEYLAQQREFVKAWDKWGKQWPFKSKP